ncbi:universal stress protein [Reichenbachiella sp. MSK19-1]|uniref:universal stress protein n=1 Tax=Reichenbachiella sp. MSK19-1 TaxID=1897631 RepID=UPI000EC6E8B4|nr:universal stress protein [Reichenbachiella sp. MSK19-1]RJE75454.1 hypothetical protein BGP76_17265 [Reichenbachiella sp. MSK19-1]
MKKILVPYDFSPFAESALELALEINEQSNGEITLVHIIEYPMGDTFHVTGEVTLDDSMDQLFTLQLIKKAKNDLQGILNKHSEQNVTYEVLMGNAFKGIASQIEAYSPDLIVMGTKGATGLAEILVGSNAEKVVRTAKCPVVTVHQKHQVKAINNIVFPTDLDVEAGSVLEKFKDFQHLVGAKIHLLHVETLHDPVSDDMAREALEKLANDHKLTNFEIHVTRGIETDQAVMNFAQEMNADMIALATHSHRGLLHLFLGSVAEDIVNHSKMPVWTMSQK